MSEENLALVASIYSEPRNYVDLLDPKASAVWIAETRPLYAHEYEFHVVVEGNRFVERGQDGYVALMMDWLTPWQSYTISVDEIRDLDTDRVAVLTRHEGPLKDGGGEVRTLGLDVWTVRDARLLRLEAYMDREFGLESAGLKR